jgi:F-box-like
MSSEHTQVVVHRRNNSSSPLDTLPTAPHPIALLPVEILSEIMCYMPLFYGHDAPSIRPLDRNLDPSRRFTRDGPIRTPHWIAVSHVCHHWRQVALRCKALWTCIPLVSVRWAQRALTLSHPHPITLRIDSRDNSLDRGYVSVDALCLALAHISRIRKVRIHSPWGTKYADRIMGIIYGALHCGAPALEEFDLASDLPFVVDSGPDGSNLVFAIAELRVLRLDQCYLPADCSLFHPGLTHLRLSGTQTMWPALESMLSTLALVPKLQILELYGVLPSEHLSSSNPPVYDLPSLKELHLGGTGQCILAVLQSLNLPENVQFFVTLPNTAAEEGSVSRWLMKLRGRQGITPDHTHRVY